MVSIASKMECTRQTLLTSVRQHERDTGQRTGVTTAAQDRVKALEPENRELRNAYEILTFIPPSSPRKRVSVLQAEHQVPPLASRCRGNDGTVVDPFGQRPESLQNSGTVSGAGASGASPPPLRASAAPSSAMRWSCSAMRLSRSRMALATGSGMSWVTP